MKLQSLLGIDDQPISQLSEGQIRELQTALAHLGYPVGQVDGLIGPRTRNAWAEFKEDIFQGKPDWIGKGSVQALQGKLSTSGEHDFSTKDGTVRAIIFECRRQGIGLPTQTAYVLATTEWETAHTFKPVREAYWKTEAWRKANFRYWPYYGRGYVQLTWKSNYQKYSNILGIDLVNSPDLALGGNVALFILVHGFKTGTFTGRKITDYINASQIDYLNARRCINGTDKAREIAELARQWRIQLSG